MTATAPFADPPDAFDSLFARRPEVHAFGYGLPSCFAIHILLRLPARVLKPLLKPRLLDTRAPARKGPAQLTPAWCADRLVGRVRPGRGVLITPVRRPCQGCRGGRPLGLGRPRWDCCQFFLALGDHRMLWP